MPHKSHTKVATRYQLSLVSLCAIAVGTLSIIYVGLIAIIISYAVLTAEFSQSVRDNEAAIAALESKYFTEISRISSIDYKEHGYVKPLRKFFVQEIGSTARR